MLYVNIKADHLTQSASPARVIRSILAAVLLSIGILTLTTGCANPLQMNVLGSSVTDNTTVTNDLNSAVSLYNQWAYDAGKPENSVLLTQAKTSIDGAFDLTKDWESRTDFSPESQPGLLKQFSDIRMMKTLIYYGLTPQYANHDGLNGHPNDWNTIRASHNAEWATAIASASAYVNSVYVKDHSASLQKEIATCHMLTAFGYLNSDPKDKVSAQAAVNLAKPIVAPWENSSNPELKALFDGVKTAQTLIDTPDAGGATDFDLAGTYLQESFTARDAGDRATALTKLAAIKALPLFNTWETGTPAERTLSGTIYFLDGLLDYDLNTTAGYADAIVSFTDTIQILETVDTTGFTAAALANYEKTLASVYYLRGIAYEKGPANMTNAVADYTKAKTLSATWNSSSDIEKAALYANVFLSLGLNAYSSTDYTNALTYLDAYIGADFVVAHKGDATTQGYNVRLNLATAYAESAVTDVSLNEFVFTAPATIGPWHKANAGSTAIARWQNFLTTVAGNTWLAADVSKLQTWVDIAYSGYETNIASFYKESFFWGVSSPRVVNGNFTLTLLNNDITSSSAWPGF